MPKIGHTSDERTDNGRMYFGDKDVAYLKEKSRQAVEEHNDMPILYFAIDWEKSKRNFYGEMPIKRFKNPRGIQVRGAYTMEQKDMKSTGGVTSQKMRLTVSLFVEQLQELGIDPLLGDYFAIGARIYRIDHRTMKDAGPGNVLLNRERMRADYTANEEEDEALQKDIWGDTLSLEYQINNQMGENLRK